MDIYILQLSLQPGQQTGDGPNGEISSTQDLLVNSSLFPITLNNKAGQIPTPAIAAPAQVVEAALSALDLQALQKNVLIPDSQGRHRCPEMN